MAPYTEPVVSCDDAPQNSSPWWVDPMPALTCPACAWWVFDVAKVRRPSHCPECATHHPRKPTPRLVPVWLSVAHREDGAR